MGDLEAHILNSLTTLAVALGGRGVVGKWLEKRAASKTATQNDLLGEVRAHGETKALVASLEARVEELERYNNDLADAQTRERVQWEQEKQSFLERIEALERLVLRGTQ